MDPLTEAQTRILAGLDQAREAVFGTDVTSVWKVMPTKRMRELTVLVDELTDMLSVYDMLLIGAYMAASARTQIQAGG